MKNYLLVLLMVLGNAWYISAQSYNDTFESDIAEGSTYEMNEEDIRFRFMNLPSCIEVQWTDEIKNFIKSKLKHKDYTQKLLGRTFMYAPYVEKCILEKGLPLDLQALYVIESGLNPKAISSAGAGGLWQLMPETAKTYGVNITANVDERFDPYKSTKAAMTLLKALHKKYDDWALALAAYNAGPARVDWAIKHGKSTNFWKIRRFMMKETQNYVPAFLAASYILQNYPWHNIKPKLPELDLQISSGVLVKEFMSFTTISQVTDIPISTLEELNPSYINDFVPPSTEGSYVILPSRVRNLFENYINTPLGERADFSSKPIIYDRSDNGDENYIKTTVTVSTGDDLGQIADAFNCYAHNVKAWNSMSSFYISKNQELVIYVPKISESYKVPVVINEVLAYNESQKSSIEIIANVQESIAVVPVIVEQTPLFVVKSADVVLQNVAQVEVSKVETPVILVAEIQPAVPTEQPIASATSNLLSITAMMQPVEDKKEVVYTNPLLKQIASQTKIIAANNVKYIYHFMGRNESLMDIAEYYENVTVENLLALNGFKDGAMPAVGSKIKVKLL